MVSHGAALKIADHELADRLAPMVLRLLDQPDVLASMRQAARALASWDAAAAIAAACRQLAGTIAPDGD
jgi:UDP-N-acetylglucosamine:LPS N-acetylglucosamine transferase